MAIAGGERPYGVRRGEQRRRWKGSREWTSGVEERRTRCDGHASARRSLPGVLMAQTSLGRIVSLGLLATWVGYHFTFLVLFFTRVRLTSTINHPWKCRIVDRQT